MPRSPSTFSLPPGTTPQQPNTVIQSATWNAAMDDIAQTFNTIQPVVYGGTGAPTIEGARTALGSVGVIRVQAFTASGTYTPHPNMIYAIIELVGAGAGGGGCVAAPAGGVNGAGGGASGATSWVIVNKSQVGASQPVVIGANGAGAPAGNNAGIAGGTTSVGALASATGGNPGSGSTGTVSGTGGNPGSTGTGVLYAGKSGQNGSIATTLTFNGPYYGGEGADSSFGFGGRSTINSAGRNASGYGAGGGGASDFNNGGAKAGGNGSPGFVRITEFCTE